LQKNAVKKFGSIFFATKGFDKYLSQLSYLPIYTIKLNGTPLFY
jgi:hypothetical protein